METGSENICKTFESSFLHNCYNNDDPLQSQGNSLSVSPEICTLPFLLKTTLDKTLPTNSNYLTSSKLPLSSEILHRFSLKVQLLSRIMLPFPIVLSLKCTFPCLSSHTATAEP